MAITPLPDVPLRSDAPATFVTKADAFLGALNQFATEVDAVGVALTLGATNATSTTSLVIGLGSKSLTVQTGKSYVVGMTVKIASTATGVNWMLGDITSYTTGTGDLVVTVVGISGSGTFAAWSISQSATGGAKLGINSDITSLTALDTSILNIGSGQLYKGASGNVGIGTTAPTALRTKNLEVSSTGTNDGAAVIVGKRGTGIATVRLTGLDTTVGTDISFNFPNTGDLSFYDRAAAAFRMAIDSSGNLLVGATNAYGTSSAGNTHIAGGSSQQLFLRHTAATVGKYWKLGPDNGTNNMTVMNNSGVGVYMTDGANTWSSTSDERLKTDLIPIENGLDKVNSLRSVTGRFKTDEEGVSRSFLIAQDVQAVLPEAVSMQDDELGTLGVAYTEVIPLLVSSIKELKAIIDTQNARIEALTARLTALEAK